MAKKKRKRTFYEVVIKRPMDFLLSLIAIIILSPILIIIAIIVRIKHGSPILFKQRRPGRNEKVFTMYKFRSMTNEKDENGNLLPDEKRLTGFGKALRSTSLDELPNLFNILKGDLSIVGPRPKLIRDTWFMTDIEKRRHLIRPGLTGLAQVSGRNALSWEETFEYDDKYLEKITFFGDLKIIFKTFIMVFKRSGISTEGMETHQNLPEYLLEKGEITEEEYKNKLIEHGEITE